MDKLPQSTTDVEARSSEPTKSDKSTAPVTGIRLYVLLLSLTLASLLVFLDTSVVSTAVPKITDEFHSLPDVGWYGSAYQLGSSVFGPLSGTILRHFSLKWCYITFFAVFELGSALCGAAQSSAMLIIGRAVAGVGAAGIMSSAMTVLSATVPLEKRPATLGMLMGIAQLGSICGPLVGGAFTTGYTWRWCFYINLPFAALVAVPLLLLHIPDQHPKQPAASVLPHLHRHLDLVGFALFAPATIQLLLALQYGGNQFAWNSSQVIGLFCGAGATLIVWAAWNRRRGDDAALIPFSVVGRMPIWASGVNYAFTMATLFGTTYFLPIYFQAVKGASAVMSGVDLLAVVLPQMLAAVVGVNKVGRVPPFALVGAVLSTVGSGLFSTLSPTSSTGDWVGHSILVGLGRGVALQMPLVAIQAVVSPQEMSQAMAFAVWCQYMGPTIFIALYNAIFDTTLRRELSFIASALNPELVIAAGATGFRSVVPTQYVPAVIQAFATSLDHTFYLQAGAGFVAFCAAFGMGWQKLRSKSNESPVSSDQPGVSQSETEDQKGAVAGEGQTRSGQ
ncbi:6e0811bf-bff1-4eaf-a8be-81f39ed09282 [Thermothielavioides terrestris]|uniref:6e0811bf-bff1-4eaf-a8be-81f39ed09282 n=1 Tax=Thermothielavioides terrestris TaxID=2587410 RepID=A0A3S4EU75_9PEZI|nr:6e0811bf-bff1-4eaf-a8be-81f39ed09282 [Thermothielavioides terrestris]